MPWAIYEEYAERGESENRNKELKRELQADRLSDHRFVANYFRLYLHAAALNLLVRLRHAVVLSPPTTAELGLPAELPTAAIDVPDRKRFFNRRRVRARPSGGRIRQHVADSVDQGRRRGDHPRPACDRAAVGELAAPGPLLGGQPSGRRSAAEPFFSVS